ncbi:MAG: SMC family ATPase [candidate division WOR-3 bacterium]
MRLISLRLRNFLSHEDTYVEFPETGITLISGENATGKSSLFDAFRFALFSRRAFPRPRDLISKGAKSFSVEAKFKHKNSTYTIIREYAAAGDTLRPTRAEIRVDGRLAAEGVNPVDSFIIREIGLNHEMFKYSVMAVQNEISGVLGLSSQERKAVFERMFGYQHLILIAEAVRSLAESDRDLIKGLLGSKGYKSKAGLEHDISQKNASLSEQKSALSALILEKEALKTEERRLSEKGRAIEEEDKALKEAEIEKAAILSEIRVREEEIASLERWCQESRRKISELPELKESLAQLEGPLAELSALREEKDLVEIYEKRGSEASALEKRLEEINGYEKELARLSPIHEEFLRLREEERRAQEELAGFKEAFGKATELTERLNWARRKRELAEQKLQEFSGIAETKGDLLARIEANESELRKTEAERGAAEERAKKAQKDISEVQTLGEICPLCKQTLSQEHKARVLGILEKEFREASGLVDNLAAKLEALKKEIEELKRMVQKAEQKERLSEELLGLLTEEKELRERLEALSGVKEKHEALVSKISELRGKIQELEPDENAFVAAEGFIRRNPKGELELKLSDIRKEMEALRAKRRFPDMGLDEIKKRINDLLPSEKTAIKISSAIETLEALAIELVNRESTLGSKRSELAESRARLDRLRGIEEKRAELEKRKRAHSEALELLRNKQEELNERENDLSKAVAFAEQELRNLSDIHATIEQAEKRIGLFSRIREKLESPQGIEKEFKLSMRRLEDNLNAYFRDFSFSGLHKVRLNENFEPVKIDEMGREMARLSGGEQVALDIAMRFSIARTLLGTESESLFLDEPTHNLDQERMSSLGQLLMQFRTHPISPQLIIITHEEDMKAVADTTIEVIKEGGFSRVILE